MTIRKFAAFEVLEATLAPTGGQSLRAYAHRHSFAYDPRPGYLYIRSRAISSRTNDNFDTFPPEEIKSSYMSFVGKPVFVNHNNDNHRRARGVIIDAALHEDRNPDGSPDVWSEVLMEVDAVRFPKLAKAILAGHIDRTSMGTDVAFSKCSFCGNKATTPLEYCKHIPKMKGQRIYRTVAGTNTKEGVLVSEICHGLKFFENSLLVEEPADPTAFFTGVDDHSSMSKSAMIQTPISPRPPVTPPPPARPAAPKIQVEAGGGSGVKQPLIEGHTIGWDTPTKPGPDGMYHGKCSCGHVGPPRDNHIDAYGDALDHGGSKNPDYNLERIQERALEQQSPPPEYKKTPDDRQRDADQDKHYDSWSGTNPRNWQLANLQTQAVEVKVSEMTPAQLKVHRRNQVAGKKWNRDNKPHVDNVLDHWNAATEHERHTGMNWYKDAHELTKHVASDTKTPMHVAAGLMSNYSPQTHWATNMMNAAKAMRLKKGLGGKGDGIFAGEKQKTAANKIMGTEGHAQQHYDDVLGGPKTKAFAHLIHHGGNEDPSKPRVVVDRHALSVACGSRCSDVAYSYSGLGGKKRYDQVSDTYHKAAAHITKTTGVKVEAHQVQAATWLARQRLNAAEDKRGTEKVASKETAKWNEYAGEHHPLAMGKEPGTGYSVAPEPDAPEDVHHSHELTQEGHHGNLHAEVPPTDRRRRSRLMGRGASMVYLAYGETKAPEDVDTLRDEECPVCAESDAYDGNRCDVCGFDAPPKMFQDPDLDMAKQLDLRKEVMQDDMNDPNNDGMPDVIPGSGGMGVDAPPPLAGMVPDPQDVGQQQVNQIMEQQGPLDPNQLDPNGQPMAPPDPMAQDMPMDPNAMPMDPSDIAGADPMDNSGMPEPGTPGDAVADLVCPACGFQQGAAPPQSTDMDSAPAAIAESAGALCPQCQSAPLMTTQDLDQIGLQSGMPSVMPRAAALAFPIILSGMR